MAYVETAEDLNIKYESTFAALKESKNLIMLSSFSYFDTEIVVNYKVVKTGTSFTYFEELWKSLSKKVVTDYPDMGVVNFEDSVLFLKRKLKLPSPSKYRKGLRSDSFIGFDPTYLEKEALSLSRTPFENKKKLLFRIGSELFFKNHFEYEEALDLMLTGKRLGCSLNNTYYLTVSFHLDCVLLWRNSHIIGKITNKGTTPQIDILTEIFNKELNLIGIPV